MPRRGKQAEAPAPEEPAIDEKALAKAKAEMDLASHASHYVERHPSSIGDHNTPFSDAIAVDAGVASGHAAYRAKSREGTPVKKKKGGGR